MEADQPLETASDSPRGATPKDLQLRADRLKERVYITFSALAVTLALEAEVEHLSIGAIAATLTVSVVGTLLAVVLADLVAHITVHAAIPDRTELAHIVSTAVGALGVLVIPLLTIGLAATGVISAVVALRAITVVLAATLVAVGYLAARRLRLRIGQRVLVLLAEFGLGLLVIGLEMLAH